MATIYDVAERAGVSPATVSRVFNGVRVTEEKARLVRRAATELGFTPSRPARALRRRNSEIIALIIPDIENPFFTSLARGVEDVAQAAGYSVVLCNSDEDQDKEQRYLAIADSEQMSGVILAAAGDGSTAHALITKGRRVVAVDRAPAGLDVDTVMIDGRSGARLATRTLQEQGFQQDRLHHGSAGCRERDQSERGLGRRRGSDRRHGWLSPAHGLPARWWAASHARSCSS